MKQKINLFRQSLKLVWESAPGWALANILLSFIRSFLPLGLVVLLKMLIDTITEAVNNVPDLADERILWLIVAVAVVYFIDEISSDLSN